MKRLIVAVLILACSIPAHAAGFFFADNIGNAKNGTVVMAGPTAVQVTMTTGLDRTLVVLNDDLENPVYYGGSDCGVNTGQKINPQEKVTFQGVTAGFTFYVCTANGSAEVRLVEHS